MLDVTNDESIAKAVQEIYEKAGHVGTYLTSKVTFFAVYGALIIHLS